MFILDRFFIVQIFLYRTTIVAWESKILGLGIKGLAAGKGGGIKF